MTQTKEHIWDANGTITDTMLDTCVVDDLVTFELAKRTANGLAQFTDFVGHHNFAEELAFLRDGVPRSY